MHEKPIAVLMIMLVVTIPGISAQTYMRSLVVRGEDGLEGYRRTYDQTVIEAVVSIEGDDLILPSQVRYGAIDFNQCAPDTDGFFRCTYAQSQKISNSPGAYSIQINVFDDSGLSETFSTQINVDGEGPKTTSLSIDVDAVGPGNVTVDYIVKDYSGSGTVGCSGVSKIYLYTDAGAGLIDTLEGDGTCTVSGSVTYEGSRLVSESGTERICIKAQDRLGIEGDLYCREIIGDMDFPLVYDAYLEDDQGKLEYLSYLTSAPVIVVNISEEHSGLDKIYGDFSSLNSRYTKPILGSCEDIGRINQCRWTGIDIDVLAGGRTIIVMGKDNAGNEFEKSVELQVIYDISRPSPQYLFSDFYDSDTYYLKAEENNLTLIITETGSGFMKNKDVYLDLTEVTGEERRQADNCTTTTCYWNDIALQDGLDGELVYVWLNSDSRDDARNPFTEMRSFTFITDVVSPKITSVKVNSSSGFCPTHRDKILLNISVIEKTSYPLAIELDVSSISDAPISYSCTEVPVMEQTVQNFTCMVTISELKDYAMTRNLFISARDRAGNIGSYPGFPVTVCGLNVLPSEELDFVDSSIITTMPQKLDKTLLSSIPTLLFIKASVKPARDGVTVLAKSVDCYTEPDSDVIVDGQTFMLHERTQSPYIGVYLKNAGESDSFSVHCNISSKVKVGDQIYDNPEIDHLEKVIMLEGEALGKISDGMQDKIDEIEEEMEDLDKTIEKYDKMNGFLSMICSTAEVLAVMDAVLSIIISVLYYVFFGINKIDPWGKSFAKSAWPATCNLLTKIWNWIKTFIWPPGSGYANIPAFIPFLKWGCFIYSCRLCTGMDVLGTVSTGEAQGGIWGFGDTQGKPTALGPVSLSGFNPYKSIHISRTCLCLPGLVYNLKKQKQILCIKKTCLKDNAQAGLPTTICENAYKENQCLYVDGAAWKIAGQKGLSQFFGNLLSSVLVSLPVLSAGVAWELGCGVASVPKSFEIGSKAFCDPMTGLENIAASALLTSCMVAGGALQIAEVGALSGNAFDWDKYNADLEGEDYC